MKKYLLESCFIIHGFNYFFSQVPPLYVSFGPSIIFWSSSRSYLLLRGGPTGKGTLEL